MKNFFEIIIWFFFFLSILVWLFLLRWDVLFSSQIYKIVKLILMPGYLVITWLMVWNLVANIWAKKEVDEGKVYSKSFIIGIVVWVILALVYMFI